MWELRKIRIENIVSFREADFEFKNGVCTLIFGRNEDNAAQPCNGSGKSSLIEAIAFALTGEPLRKVKLDEIINDQADEAYICLQIHNGYNGKDFMIERRLYRKDPQTVTCRMTDKAGYEADTDRMVQPTVADYNRMILSEIGLTKDEVYSYFILCENKYKSFFDSGDKDKKEIINRFSNGVLVDKAIVKVQENMQPIGERLQSLNNEASRLRGSMAALEEQLAGADEKNAAQKANREAKLAEYDTKIGELRGKVRENDEQLDKAGFRLDCLDSMLKAVSEGDWSEYSIDKLQEEFGKTAADYRLPMPRDYKAEAKRHEEDILRTKKDIERVCAEMGDLDGEILKIKGAYDRCKDEYDTIAESDREMSEKDKAMIQGISDEIAAIDRKLDGFDAQLKEYEASKKRLQQRIAVLANILRGTITCPKCGHRFIISAEGRTLEDVEAEKQEAEGKVTELDIQVASVNKEYDALDAQAAEKDARRKEIKDAQKNRDERVSEAYQAVRDMRRKVDDAIDRKGRLQGRLNDADNELDRYSGRLENICQRLIGEFTGIIEGQIVKGKGYIKGMKESNQFLLGQIEQYQEAKKTLSQAAFTDFAQSIRDSIAKYGSELDVVEAEQSVLQEKYDALKEQETNFGMFKSYLANKKLDALAFIVNDFLEQIGSDIRLVFEGYKMLRTGRLKERIDIQILRDGVNIGSYYKRSGGEKARINLASILALQKLTNGNCESGKGLDMLIVDEILDKSDEVGIMGYCETLNRLRQTSIIITQNQVAEGYEHKVVITKSKGFSRIGQ